MENNSIKKPTTSSERSYANSNDMNRYPTLDTNTNILAQDILHESSSKVDASSLTPPVITWLIDNYDTLQLIRHSGTTDDANPTVSGTGTPSSTIMLYADGKMVGTTLVDSSGHWVLKDISTLSEGHHTLSAVATMDNQTSKESNSFSFELDLDNLPPTITALVAEGNPVQMGQVSNDTTPSLSGISKPYTEVVIYDDGKEVGRTQSNSKGYWSLTATNELSGGPHSLSAVMLRDGQPISEESKPFDFIVNANNAEPAENDAVTSDTPTIQHYFDDTGLLNGYFGQNSQTDDRTPHFSGKAQPNSLINLFDNGVPVGSEYADAYGNWTIEASLVEGSHNISAMTLNKQGEIFNSLPFSLEVTGTTTPTILYYFDDAGSQSGYYGSESKTDDTTPRFYGKGQPNTLVTLYDDGIAVGSEYADASGHWVIGTELDTGNHRLTAAAGRLSTSEPFLMEVTGTSAAARPVVECFFDDMGIQNGYYGAESKTDDTSPQFSGKSQPNALVTLLDNGLPVGSGYADSQGLWSIDTQLTEGHHSITATTNSAQGNSEPFILEVTGSATSPAPTIEYYYDDVGVQNGYFGSQSTTDDTSPQFCGTAKPNALVTLFDDGTPVGSEYADANGYWTVELQLSKGNHQLTAIASDMQGSSKPFVLEVTSGSISGDPTIECYYDNVGLEHGYFGSQTITDDPSPQFYGTAKANSLVTLYNNGKSVGSEYADAYGNWQITPQLGNGIHSLTVTFATAEGESAKSEIFEFEISSLTVNPPAPVIQYYHDDVGENKGDFAMNGRTDDKTPDIYGKAEPSSLVTLYDNGFPVGSEYADAHGNWKIRPVLEDGHHSLSATSTTSYGESQPSLSAKLEVDAIAKLDIPEIQIARDDVGGNSIVYESGITNDKDLTFIGRGNVGSVITLWSGSKLLGSSTVNSKGEWSIDAETLGDNRHSIVAVSSKPGFAEATSEIFTVTVDTKSPEAPTVYGLADNIQGEGLIAEGDAIGTHNPVIFGKSEPNVRAEFLVTNIDTGETFSASGRADNLGLWKASIYPDNLPEGNYTFQALVKDLAGNISPAGQSFNFSVDTSTVPETPRIYGAYNDDHQDIQVGFLNDSTPTVWGAGKSGQIITLYDDITQRVLGSTTVEPNGTWEIKSAELSEGMQRLYATASDKGGIESSASTFIEFDVDTIAPDVAVITGTSSGVMDIIGSADDTLFTNTPTFYGTSEPYAKITFWAEREGTSEKFMYIATADKNGLWKATYTEPLPDDNYSFRINTTDDAGNTSTSNELRFFEVDSTLTNNNINSFGNDIIIDNTLLNSEAELFYQEDTTRVGEQVSLDLESVSEAMNIGATEKMIEASNDNHVSAYNVNPFQDLIAEQIQQKY